MKPAILLLLFTLTLPAMAADPATNPPAGTTMATGQTGSSRLTPTVKLEQDKNTSTATTKKHWWNHIKILGFWTPGSKGKGTDGPNDEILQYKGLSSRPWSAISANPGYMSNDMDCRVHHPNFGVGGSY